MAGHVIDELCLDIAQGTPHHQARSLGGSRDPLSNSVATPSLRDGLLLLLPVLHVQLVPLDVEVCSSRCLQESQLS
jgi:hypothetical protein